MYSFFDTALQFLVVLISLTAINEFTRHYTRYCLQRRPNDRLRPTKLKLALQLIGALWSKVHILGIRIFPSGRSLPDVPIKCRKKLANVVDLGLCLVNFFTFK